MPHPLSHLDKEVYDGKDKVEKKDMGPVPFFILSEDERHNAQDDRREMDGAAMVITVKNGDEAHPREQR